MPKSKATKFFDFLDGKDTGYTSVLDWFEKMGGVLHTPNDDPTREVVFINPRIHESFNGLPAPAPDDYRAIPLTNMEVAASPSCGLTPFSLLLQQRSQTHRRKEAAMKKINKNIACQDLLEIQGNKHEKEKFQNAMEIVKNFPVTKSMFPVQPFRGWQVCSK